MRTCLQAAVTYPYSRVLADPQCPRGLKKLPFLLHSLNCACLGHLDPRLINFSMNWRIEGTRKRWPIACVSQLTFQ